MILQENNIFVYLHFFLNITEFFWCYFFFF